MHILGTGANVRLEVSGKATPDDQLTMKSDGERLALFLQTNVPSSTVEACCESMGLRPKPARVIESCTVVEGAQWKYTLPHRLRGTTFKDQLFVNTKWSSEFYGCTFENCVFSECDLSSCWFSDCEFKGCTIARSRLHNVRFRRCSHLGSIIEYSDLLCASVKDSSLPRIHHCNLTSSSGFPLIQIAGGTGYTITVGREETTIGCKTRPNQWWREASDQDISQLASNALDFWERNKVLVFAAMESLNAVRAT